MKTLNTIGAITGFALLALTALAAIAGTPTEHLTFPLITAWGLILYTNKEDT